MEDWEGEEVWEWIPSGGKYVAKDTEVGKQKFLKWRREKIHQVWSNLVETQDPRERKWEGA